MKYLILGASGFIGSHLTKKILSEGHQVRAFDIKGKENFKSENLEFKEGFFSIDTDFDTLTKDCEIVYHLISTTFPNSSVEIEDEISGNVFSTLKLLDACVKNKVKRIIFISSGGTVYGNSKTQIPFREDSPTFPISSYGIQKLIIEKYLHLYYHKYGLDYRVVRLSNPYGPGQNPKGAVGAITVFLDRSMHNEEITIFGDGSSIRDYIFIKDAICGIMNISSSENKDNKIYNLGAGLGISLKEIIKEITILLDRQLNLKYLPSRDSDVNYSVLDTTLYTKNFPNHKFVNLKEGISELYLYFQDSREKK